MKDTMQEADRVRRNTQRQVLLEADQTTEENIRYYASQGEQAIGARLEELEREWDMEHVLSINASILALSGALMGFLSNRKWFLLTCTVTGFLFEHAISGWCPPVPIFRRLGIRTRGEIDCEKFALKGFRGDFRNIPAHLREALSVQEAVESVKS